jgi:hypothetical protein
LRKSSKILSDNKEQKVLRKIKRKSSKKVFLKTEKEKKQDHRVGELASPRPAPAANAPQK